jgi:hypothetical protein
LRIARQQLLRWRQLLYGDAGIEADRQIEKFDYIKSLPTFNGGYERLIPAQRVAGPAVPGLLHQNRASNARRRTGSPEFPAPR